MPRSWRTERLVLCQVEPSRAKAVCEYGVRSREYHRPWDPVRPSDYWTEDVVGRRLAAELEQAVEDRGLALYLARTEQPSRLIGRVSLSNIVRGAQQGCVVGYGLEPDVIGQGYMTEALAAVVRVAFEDLRLHRVEANVIPRNDKSIALLERCGFLREGLSPKYLRIAGRWEDHIRFSRRNLAMETGE